MPSTGRTPSPSDISPVRAADPPFTLADLLAGEVIVTNNVSLLDFLPEKDPDEAAAFETAVRQEGRGVLGFHASAEDGGGHWDFYQQCLNPMEYASHSYSVQVPVFKDARESGHVALEGVLATGTPMRLSMGVDANGVEVRRDVVARYVTTEENRYARNILADSVFGPLTTPLLRFDPTNTSLETRYRFPGGNAYAFILQAGRGKTGYIATGHNAAEINTGTSFDAKTGDFERFYAQMLFYLAGYRVEPCGGTVDCSGLPVVDAADHLVPSPNGVAMTYDCPEFFSSGSIGFAYTGTSTYQALLTDVRGQVRASRNGSGSARFEFDAKRLPPGVYCLSVRIGAQAPRIKRYAIPFFRGGNGR